jgi:hypothetical protein
MMHVHLRHTDVVAVQAEVVGGHDVGNPMHYLATKNRSDVPSRRS